MIKFYFGGQFQFRYEDYSFEEASKDYRSLILKNPHKFIDKPKEGFYVLSNDVLYVGPFYFYNHENLIPPQRQVVETESNCVRLATDCVFVLSNSSAPGTITEIIHATLLQKNIYIFYVSNNSYEEIENDLWYAIQFASINNPKTIIRQYPTYESAKEHCIEFINDIIKIHDKL